MSGRISNELRDSAITSFRQAICDKNNIVPLVHQQEWFSASDGAVLLGVKSEDGVAVRLGDNSIEKRAVGVRAGGRAKVIADLGAFKVGKSFGAALWAAAFAIVPDARVQLVGLEYDICAPEFEYICQFLLSDSGMGIKADSLQNRPRDGRMWLDLPNGARFEAKSWERKDTLKGKEIDCYLYCEAYMLPGLECYTSFSQNLRARDGYAVFATTPDRPWVKELHDRAHSGDEDFKKWHCTCGVHSSSNSITFDQSAMDRDRNLMTREKFQIHYEGKLGDFVGRVYGYQRGERTFTQSSHPGLFKGGGERANISIPDGWDLVGGADTGTYASAGIVAFSPDGDAFVLDEFPNYDYVSGVPERRENLTIPEWAYEVYARMVSLGGKPFFWADKNTQFKREFASYRDFTMNLMANLIPLEARTEIAREYFTHNKIWLAPWLKVLPFELENACWPEEATSAGKFARVKDRDHTLDWMEHILSKRPRGRGVRPANRSGTWIESFVGTEAMEKRKQRRDRHLGNQ